MGVRWRSIANCMLESEAERRSTANSELEDEGGEGRGRTLCCRVSQIRAGRGVECRSMTNSVLEGNTQEIIKPDV